MIQAGQRIQIIRRILPRGQVHGRLGNTQMKLLQFRRVDLVVAHESEARIDNGMEHDARCIRLEAGPGGFRDDPQPAQRAFDRRLFGQQLDEAIMAVKSAILTDEPRFRELRGNEPGLRGQRRHVSRRHRSMRSPISAGARCRQAHRIAKLGLVEFQELPNSNRCTDSSGPAGGIPSQFGACSSRSKRQSGSALHFHPDVKRRDKIPAADFLHPADAKKGGSDRTGWVQHRFKVSVVKAENGRRQTIQ